MYEPAVSYAERPQKRTNVACKTDHEKLSGHAGTILTAWLSLTALQHFYTTILRVLVIIIVDLDVFLSYHIIQDCSKLLQLYHIIMVKRNKKASQNPSPIAVAEVVAKIKQTC